MTIRKGFLILLMTFTSLFGTGLVCWSQSEFRCSRCGQNPLSSPWRPWAPCVTVAPTCFAVERSGPCPLPAESPPTALCPPWRTHRFVNTLSNGCLLCPLLETSGSLLFLAQALGNLRHALCQVQPPWHLPHKRLLPEPCGCISQRYASLQAERGKSSSKQRVPISQSFQYKVVGQDGIKIKMWHFLEIK